ncbi:MAG TPA: hypothetical protein VFB88_13820, partial [Xanthobacteraceae bacterium]|nr:hypothetical protein [Xanthobacteraceae bacterium]
MINRLAKFGVDVGLEHARDLRDGRPLDRERQEPRVGEPPQRGAAAACAEFRHVVPEKRGVARQRRRRPEQIGHVLEVAR